MYQPIPDAGLSKGASAMNEQKCYICGCTDDNACVTEDGPCYWVDDDLCSVCFEKLIDEKRGIQNEQHS